MKIREIQLQKFKRFTATTITNIPVTARLVLLVGPNGCGKSSLIDAAHLFHGRQFWGGWDEDYHGKKDSSAAVGQHQSVAVEFHPPGPTTDAERRKSIYVRSAYRNDAEFQLGNLSRVEAAVNERRITKLIENDLAVSRNYQRLVSQAFAEVFETAPPGQTMAEFREHTIGSIKSAMERLFPGLVLNSLGNPLVEGTFKFDKGDSTAFLYKNLSGGEKASFDLILDLLIKGAEFNDTVFFIDEPEAHIASALQAGLLAELMTSMPATSQLWIATHSIGMMRKARDIEEVSPGTVVFLDFEGVNFDLPATLTPVTPDKPFWKRAMRVALDDLAGFVAPEEVVLCEGGLLQGGKDFDAEIYNAVFSASHPNSFFIGAGNANDVENDPARVQRLINALAPGIRIRRLLDRDDRTDAEIVALQAQGIRVLNLRNIESYLLSDEVLTSVCGALNAPNLAPRLLAAKRAALEASIAAGFPADDLKRIAGDVYVAARALIQGHRLGNDKRAFMRAFCTKEIVPGTATYVDLSTSVFGP